MVALLACLHLLAHHALPVLTTIEAHPDVVIRNMRWRIGIAPAKERTFHSFLSEKVWDWASPVALFGVRRLAVDVAVHQDHDMVVRAALH